MSKTAICEAVYDGMLARGLDPEHEAFEDILMSCCAVAAMEDPHGVDVLTWVEEHERKDSFERMFSQEEDTGRTAVQVYLDWRAYLNKCSKKSMKLTALLAALVAEGAAVK